MYGIIDIGSNTIRLSAYNVEEKNIRPVFHKKVVAGLAGYVNEQGQLSPKGIQRAINVLNDFKAIVSSTGIETTYVFATASLRNIKNTEEAVNLIQGSTGFTIQVLTGEEEATYDFYGATLKIQVSDGLLIDIGGGSTELVFYKNREIVKAFSIPIGSLNTYSRYVSNLMPNKSEKNKIKKMIIGELANIDFDRNLLDTRVICGVGGTIRAANKLSNDFWSLPSSNRQLNVNNLKKLLHSYYKDDKQFLIKLLQLAPDRLHTIIPGIIILRAITKFYSSESICVSEYGVREGYLVQMLKIKGEIDD